MKDLKKFIDYIKNSNIDKSKVLELLKNESSLENWEKNIIYVYCFPRQLLDRELPSRIQNNRIGRSINKIDYPDIALIIEAGQTNQYKRFIQHLMHSFYDFNTIYKTDMWEESFCPICGEPLNIDTAFGSSQSSIVLCDHCLLQLQVAIQLMENIDPSYLDWKLRYLK